MNNTSTNNTARLASEKQTAFIAKLFQSIPWNAITMHEASSTIRALLKLRDAHKPAEETKAGKKERSKEKITTPKETKTNDAHKPAEETEIVKAEIIKAEIIETPEQKNEAFQNALACLRHGHSRAMCDFCGLSDETANEIWDRAITCAAVASAPKNEPIPSAPETAKTAEKSENKPVKKSKKGEEACVRLFNYQNKSWRLPVKIVKNLGNGLAYVVYQNLDRQERKIIDLASGLFVVSREQTGGKNVLAYWEQHRTDLLTKVRGVRKGSLYEKRIEEFRELPIAYEYAEAAELRAAERAEKRQKKIQKTFSVHSLDGKQCRLRVNLVKDMGDGLELVKWLARDHHWVYSIQDKKTWLGLITGGRSYVMGSWEQDKGELIKQLAILRQKESYQKTCEKVISYPVQDVEPEKMRESYNCTFNAVQSAQRKAAMAQYKAEQARKAAAA